MRPSRVLIAYISIALAAMLLGFLANSVANFRL